MNVGTLGLYSNFRRLTVPWRTLGSRWDGAARILKRDRPRDVYHQGCGFVIQRA